MKYIISYDSPNSHFVDIEYIITNHIHDKLLVQLPAWRPGRYELGNFAKNIQRWNAFDENGNRLKYRKISKDCWEIDTPHLNTIHIKYNYYAIDLNAGSTYLDEKQLYVNPVNCCLYIPDRIEEECVLELLLPLDYKVATAMKTSLVKKANEINYHHYLLKNFHELADSPFIASNSIKHNMFIMDGVEFHLWFQGECKPNWPKLINDFFIFINEQLTMMKTFPSDTYHFLFQILPQRFYHGVEHLNSTVIALGPSYRLMGGDLYDDLLGISSHELFHAWNIKSIRPAEMYPYDYSKENYSRLGFVCEGVTTYYGDFLLFRSGVFSEFDYFKTVCERLQKHFDNFGRFNLSVADSSFDTWLDGYVQGIPNRKTSIYDEGSMIAFMTDVLIRKYTNNDKSLDDVMRYLYEEFSKKGKGYTERDYQGIVEHLANHSFNDFFRQIVYGTNSYEELFRNCLNYIGCELLVVPSKKMHEAYFGFKIAENNLGAKITAIYPNSIADLAGLSIGDEIIALNNIYLKNDFTEWTNYFGNNREIELMVNSVGYIKSIKLRPKPNEVYYKNYSVSKSIQVTDEQKSAYLAWCRRNF